MAAEFASRELPAEVDSAHLFSPARFSANSNGTIPSSAKGRSAGFGQSAGFGEFLITSKELHCSLTVGVVAGLRAKARRSKEGSVGVVLPRVGELVLARAVVRAVADRGELGALFLFRRRRRLLGSVTSTAGGSLGVLEAPKIAA